MIETLTILIAAFGVILFYSNKRVEAYIAGTVAFSVLAICWLATNNAFGYFMLIVALGCVAQLAGLARKKK